MRTLIAMDDENKAEEIAVKLIPHGHEPYIVDDKSNLFNLLATEIFHILLFDLDSEKLGGISTVRESKKIKPEIAIIVLTFRSGIDIMKEVISAGGIGVVSIRARPDEIAEQVVRTIELSGIKIIERRRFVRVSVFEDEESKVVIPVKELGKELVGRVSDISAGGIAVRFNDPVEASILTVGKVYPNIKIYLDDREIKTSAMVVGKRGLIVAFRFYGMDEAEQDKVAKYVYKKLMSKEYRRRMLEKILAERI